MKGIRYQLSVSGAGGDADLVPDQCEYLVLKEMTDGRLPEFQCKVSRVDDKFLRCLVDMAVVTIKYWSTDQDQSAAAVVEGLLVEYLIEDEKVGSVMMNGTLNLPDYVTTSNILIIHASSVGAISNLTSLSQLNLINDVNYGGASDVMTWIQAARTDKQFAIDIMINSRISETSSLIFAIDWMKNLIMTNTPDGGMPPYRWILTNNPNLQSEGGNSIPVNLGKRTYSCITNSLGTDMILPHYDVDTSEYAEPEIDLTDHKIFTESIQDKAYGKIDKQRLAESEDPNIMKDFVKNWKRNLNILMSLRRFKITTKTNHFEYFNQMHLLDIVKLVTNSPAVYDEESTHSGCFFVGEKRLTGSKHAGEFFIDIFRESPVY